MQSTKKKEIAECRGKRGPQRKLHSIISQVKNSNLELKTVGEDMGASSEDASNIKSLERMIGKQTEQISEASAAVEQMIGNISSVNQSVDKMIESFDDLRINAQNGSDKQHNANERIQVIENQSQMLQEDNAAISAIA